MGQRRGVLLKEVSAFRRCPLIEVSLYLYAVLGNPWKLRDIGLYCSRKH